MAGVRIAAIVEGHGECEAVPVLLRRIARELDQTFVPHVLPPIRVPASRLVKEGEIERAVELAALKLQGKGGVIVVLDCDSDDCCPARDAPAILARARKVRNDVIVSVVMAKKEFESWFIAAATSLRGKRGLAANLESPPDPELIRDAKGWLGDRMSGGYSETDDQPALAAMFDLAEARRSDSFDKCYREMRAMLERLRGESLS